jgi:2-polyprenyl-6-methoxyphenol hydroxylase-like FAD-dependent oxidoreductase
MNAATVETLSTQCCIVGGGPAGMMLGYLLARAGVDVVVLEKHADFLRDFRGDTIHPSTLELMHELGVIDDFLRRPHQESPQIGAWIGDDRLTIADFSHLPTHCKFLAFMPQWDFLNFIAEKAGRYPNFHLRLQAEVTDLLGEGDRVVGVAANTPSGTLHVKSSLTVGCDGRTSVVRARAGLQVTDHGAPMDVLWMRISKSDGDPVHSLGRVARGHVLVLLDRGEYWQCGFVIAKGSLDQWKQQGLSAFQEELRATAPFFGDRVRELREWSDVKLLTVKVDRLEQWHRPGLLCIGDAAHAMSPVGGVGINLAIQDAVAAANRLADPLYFGTLEENDLAAVQHRRERPTCWTQRLQILIQNRVIRRILDGDGAGADVSLPFPLRVLRACPRLQRIPARVIGLGFRPEHVGTPERLPRQ